MTQDVYFSLSKCVRMLWESRRSGMSLLHTVTQAEGNSVLGHMWFLSSGHWCPASGEQELEAVKVGPTSLLLMLELGHVVTAHCLCLVLGEQMPVSTDGPFYRGRNWVSEKLTNFLNGTLLVYREGKIHIQVSPSFPPRSMENVEGWLGLCVG